MLFKDYYIVDFNNLDELKDYIENKLPIKARKIKLDDRRFIYNKLNVSKDMLVYLSNYKQIYEQDMAYLKEKEIKFLTQNQCKKCIFYEERNTHYAYCKNIYEPDENKKCICYIEHIPWYKKLLSLF